MSDLIARLRDASDGWSADALAVSAEVADEAADTIASLTEEVERLGNQYQFMCDQHRQVSEIALAAEATIERLRAALEAARGKFEIIVAHPTWQDHHCRAQAAIAKIDAALQSTEPGQCSLPDYSSTLEK